jgi:four helix bundle protein
MSTYKDLFIWQKSVALTLSIYKLTSKFPKEELYGLISQMRRSAVSIPANIAEGRRRESDKEFRRFLLISYGSGAELETHIEISKQLGFLSEADAQNLDQQLSEVMRMINKMLYAYRQKIYHPISD